MRRTHRVRRWLTTSGALASAGLLSQSAHAATVTLIADRDNTLFEDVNGSLSNGAGPYAFAAPIRTS
jgi:hypothetical protein